MLLCVLWKAVQRSGSLLRGDSQENPKYAVETVPSIQLSRMSQDASDTDKMLHHSEVMNGSRKALLDMAKAHGVPVSEMHDLLPGHYPERNEHGVLVETKNPMTRVFAGFARRNQEGALSSQELDKLHEFAGAVAHGFNQDSVGYMVPNKIEDPEDGNGTFWHLGRPLNREDMNWLQGELSQTPYAGTAIVADPKGMHTLDWGERGEHQPFRQWLANKLDERYGADNNFAYEPFRDDGGLAYRKSYTENGDRVAGEEYPSGVESNENGNTAGRVKSPIWEHVPALKRAFASGRSAAYGSDSTVKPQSGQGGGVVVVKGFRGRTEEPRDDADGVQGWRRLGSDAGHSAGHTLFAVLSRRDGADQPS